MVEGLKFFILEALVEWLGGGPGDKKEGGIAR
jgi:hypothetical protein